MRYFENIRDELKIDPSIREDLVRELQTHLDDRSREMTEKGVCEKDAGKIAAALMGSPAAIARQLYEAYSRGSWRHAFFAALPHLLIAIVYAINWWTSFLWVAVTIFVVIGAVIYGWTHGRPGWLFPWLGYVLIPVIAVGVLLIYLPVEWGWAAAMVYVPVAIVILFLIIRPIMKIDWLMVSLMLVPIPVILCWGMVFNWWGLAEHTVSGLMGQTLAEASPWVSASFIALAMAVAVFVRVRQRWLKVAVLLTPELIIVTAVALYQKSALNIWGWLALVIVVGCSLAIPAILDGIIRKTLVARKMLKSVEQ